MAQAALVDKLIEAGKALVKALDAAQLSPANAMWFYRADTDDWVLVLAAVALDPVGPIESYKKVLKVLRDAQQMDPLLSALQSDDVVLKRTNHPIFQPLRGLIDPTATSLHSVRVRNSFLNGGPVDDVLVYRMAA
jgi:hypothetical protein